MAYIIPHKSIENWQYMEATCFILKTVSDRAKRSLFSTPVGLLTTFENIDFGSHDLGNVNWPKSQKPLEIEGNGAFFLTLWVNYHRNYNF